MRRQAPLVVLVLAAVLAVPALGRSAPGSSAGSANVLKAFARQLPVVKKKTTVAILLPASLPFPGKVPRLYAGGFGTKNTWGLVLTGAPFCAGANACFVASFEGKRGGKLPGKPNLKLPGGQPALYKPITCGASCSPASLWFVHRGVLYSWQHKDPPKNAKAVFARLAAQAISAGPR